MGQKLRYGHIVTIFAIGHSRGKTIGSKQNGIKIAENNAIINAASMFLSN
jgi:hypothetical protein